MDTVGAQGPAAKARRVRLTVPEGGERPPGRTPVWDVVVVPSRQGLEAVDILRLRTRVGPVLHDHGADTLGFLVPAGTSAGWDLPGSACTGAGPQAPQAPQGAHPGRRPAAGPAATGSGWLLPPEHAAPVTDPALLRIALGEAARTIEAAGGVRRR